MFLFKSYPEFVNLIIKFGQGAHSTPSTANPTHPNNMAPFFRSTAQELTRLDTHTHTTPRSIKVKVQKSSFRLKITTPTGSPGPKGRQRRASAFSVDLTILSSQQQGGKTRNARLAKTQN
jgi:hypothetical protein